MDLYGKCIHFMGIGGIGVSALAAMSRHAGATVTGCDRCSGPVAERLMTSGIPVTIGHDPRHIEGTDLLVYSSAIPPTHPERLAAGAAQMRRGEFLARFLDAAEGFGVCGTHGKTTTTWLLAHLLLRAGRDPTVFIGGVVPDLEEGNFRLGTGPFVAELDESDGTFLLPKLKVAAITNVESDHLSHYRTEAALRDAFTTFAKGVAESGLLVANADDPVAAAILATHAGRRLSFAVEADADLRAVEVLRQAGGSTFAVFYRGRDLGRFTLTLPGRHNVLNALAALGCALEYGIEPDVLRTALHSARGVGRRLEYLGALGAVPVYTDYAHHPTEITAALDAVRQVHQGRVLVVFQPHLFSRTRDYADGFAASLARADTALVTEIYPAREEPILGISAVMLVNMARVVNPDVHHVQMDSVAGWVRQAAPEYAAIVFMGAGDIDSVARSMAPGPLPG